MALPWYCGGQRDVVVYPTAPKTVIGSSLNFQLPYVVGHEVPGVLSEVEGSPRCVNKDLHKRVAFL